MTVEPGSTVLLQVTELTPLAAHQDRTGGMSRPVVALATAEQVVPEDGRPLGRQQQEEQRESEEEEREEAVGEPGHLQHGPFPTASRRASTHTH